MTLEQGRNAERGPSIYIADVSKGWDTVSQTELFIKALRKMPFYRASLLYSGFDADGIGKSWHSAEDPGVIYCTDEHNLTLEHADNPFQYALAYKNPAIGVYDPDKMEPLPSRNEFAHTMKDPSALIAIVRLKF
ncbi:hypothetical protein C4556_03850 [Candidatus Parcubacteria bacterium]|nr:MAG: hypothetical protein C4556_03850 [Candidatus Parcubacteria bacterium]